jgi:hypothetical protein
VRAEVQGSQYCKGNLAVETESIKADRRDLLTVLVQGADLGQESERVKGKKELQSAGYANKMESRYSLRPPGRVPFC